jgi:hypothetical protein
VIRPSLDGSIEVGASGEITSDLSRVCGSILLLVNRDHLSNPDELNACIASSAASAAWHIIFSVFVHRKSS